MSALAPAYKKRRGFALLKQDPARMLVHFRRRLAPQPMDCTESSQQFWSTHEFINSVHMAPLPPLRCRWQVQAYAHARCSRCYRAAEHLCCHCCRACLSGPPAAGPPPLAVAGLGLFPGAASADAADTAPCAGLARHRQADAAAPETPMGPFDRVPCPPANSQLQLMSCCWRWHRRSCPTAGCPSRQLDWRQHGIVLGSLAANQSPGQLLLQAFTWRSWMCWGAPNSLPALHRRCCCAAGAPILAAH